MRLSHAIWLAVVLLLVSASLPSIAGIDSRWWSFESPSGGWAGSSVTQA
jgi:hypothetical protein